MLVLKSALYGVETNLGVRSGRASFWLPVRIPCMGDATSRRLLLEVLACVYFNVSGLRSFKGAVTRATGSVVTNPAFMRRSCAVLCVSGANILESSPHIIPFRPYMHFIATRLSFLPKSIVLLYNC
jgi:hypothetical protein